MNPSVVQSRPPTAPRRDALDARSIRSSHLPASAEPGLVHDLRQVAQSVPSQHPAARDPLASGVLIRKADSSITEGARTCADTATALDIAGDPHFRGWHSLAVRD
jgi:hypothetical protein